MLTSSTPPVTTIPAKTNLWPIRIVSLLLALQGLGLLALSWVWLMQVDWPQQPVVRPEAEPALERLALGLLIAPVAGVILLAAVAFLFLQRVAWLTAMLAQGFILFNGLSIYFVGNSTFANSTFGNSTLRDSHPLYLIMLSAILLVLYLNSHDVRQAFALRKMVLTAPPLNERDFERIETHRAQPVNNALDARHEQ